MGLLLGYPDHYFLQLAALPDCFNCFLTWPCLENCNSGFIRWCCITKLYFIEGPIPHSAVPIYLSALLRKHRNGSCSGCALLSAASPITTKLVIFAGGTATYGNFFFLGTISVPNASNLIIIVLVYQAIASTKFTRVSNPVACYFWHQLLQVWSSSRVCGNGERADDDDDMVLHFLLKGFVAN